MRPYERLQCTMDLVGDNISHNISKARVMRYFRQHTNQSAALIQKKVASVTTCVVEAAVIHFAMSLSPGQASQTDNSYSKFHIHASTHSGHENWHPHF